MKKENAKKWGAVAGSVVLASSALAGVGTAVAAEAPEAGAAVQAQAAEGVQAGATKAVAVEGEFAYDQAVVTPTATVSGMFAKAAATLCASVPEYAQQCAVCGGILVTAPGASMEATVADMADEAGGKSMLMGCACSTNGAGGGAIVNAEAEGVAIATVLAMLA